MTGQDNKWRLEFDRHIPIAVVFGMFLQFAGFVWMMAKMDARIETLEIWQMRQVSYDKTTEDRVLSRIRALETDVSGMKVEIRAVRESTGRIEGKLDRAFDKPTN